MFVRTEAYVEYSEKEAERVQAREDLHTERVGVRLRDVYRYQENTAERTPGTVVWLEPGGTPTLVIPYEDFDRLMREHFDVETFNGGFDPTAGDRDPSPP